MSDLTDVKFFLASLIRPIVKEAIREEFCNLQNAGQQSKDEVGGMKLFCEVSGLSEARGYALVSARKVPHSKRGNRLFFRRSELEAWIAEGKRQQKMEVIL